MRVFINYIRFLNFNSLRSFIKKHHYDFMIDFDFFLRVKFAEYRIQTKQYF